jgi:4-deoxy-L-threo-5-hexosulose-uronate ketol-isomerase
MSTYYEVRYATNPEDFKSYDTERIRRDFLIKGLLQADQVRMVYSHYDRLIAGGAVPVSKTLKLETIDPLKADYFLERRELGIINIGGAGKVTVDGEAMKVGFKEALYIGRSTKEVTFSSENSDNPAHFYFNSAPAHHAYPTQLITRADAEVVELGALETSNERTIRKLIVNSIVKTCQLQMGMTELNTGSVWNTMPAHVHDRRMEVYLYFELPEDQAVCHFMGQPEASRPVWLQNQDAVISPPWSMHCGAGTSNYTFIWGMAGENLDYGDMDKFSPGKMQ